MEQGRFGTHQNLQGLIENWSLRIGHWPLNSASATAQWPSSWRFQSASPIMSDLLTPASRRRFPVAGSGKSLPRGPQNVKEQARERRTRATLPQFYGNATFIFSEFTAEHAGQRIIHGRIPFFSPSSLATQWLGGGAESLELALFCHQHNCFRCDLVRFGAIWC